MTVHEAGRGEAAAAVDAVGPGGDLGWRPRPEGGDARTVGEDPALGDLGAGGVDRRDGAAVDEDGAHRMLRADASRTASRIFS